MSFRLGNFSIDEVLYGVAESDTNILYTLDQLSSAQIEISAESTDITDKKGNVVRTQYTSKTGTFTATNAFLHTQIAAAQGGQAIKEASSTAKIEMPKIEIVEAGNALNIEGAKDGTIKVIGLYGDGANDPAMDATAVTALITGTKSTEGVYESGSKLTVPAAATGAPIQYLVKYDRDMESGYEIVNSATKFPDTIKLTLFCSYVSLCEDELKPCYVVMSKFMPDPSVTISLDRESQEMDFNGNLQLNYCSTDKELYVLYFPDEDIVIPAVAA